MADGGLKYGPLDGRCVHLCIDMQRLFAEPTAWHAPWLPTILPRIHEITLRHPERTVFTRFITAKAPGMGHGAWKRYYERWAEMTVDELGKEMLDLVPELRRFAPPAAIFDKHVYSPWMETRLHAWLQERKINTLVITGGETDVCVMATVMGAIDLGYRVVVVKDAIWSSADETHDKIVDLYCERFQLQLEAADMDVILRAWNPT